MRFLADESVEGPVVAALRRAGHAVAAVAEDEPGTRDERVLARARQERRVLLTNDKDFAELAFLQRRAATGIVLIRMPRSRSSRKARRLLELVEQLGTSLRKGFTVLEAAAHAIEDEELRRGLVERGRARAAGFTWEACARGTLATYAGALDTVAPRPLARLF